MGGNWIVIVEAAMSNTAVISSDCKNGPKEFLTYGKGDFYMKAINLTH